MITFTSIAELDRLTKDNPAKPVVKQLLEWLIADGELQDHPYDPEEHGYIALVESGDALELVSAWDIRDEDFAQTVNNQARLMAGIHPDDFRE